MARKLSLAVLALCAGAAPAFSQTIATVAGGGPNNLPPLVSSVGTPAAVVKDSTGNLYISDSRNHQVYKVSTTGQLTIFAGIGAAGYSGDGGLATAAALNSPRGLALDGSGDLYIADSGNNVIREVVAATGNIQTVAGNGAAGATGDGGAATSAGLSAPAGVFVDSNGNIFIADTANNEVREVAAAGNTISRIAGTGVAGFTGNGGLATSAMLNAPVAVFLDSSGNIYISDRGNNVVREIVVATGNIQTVAGNGTAGGSGDGGAATSAELNAPNGIFLDAANDIFIADTNNNIVREVVASTGKIQTVAGNGIAAFSGDGGNAIFAELSGPQALFADSVGDLFIGDTGNSVLREVIETTHSIHTIAGNLTLAFSGDGNLATSAALNNPSDASLDGAGDIFIADSANDVVREVIAATGVITTVAGRGPGNSSVNGTAATNAILSNPSGVFADGSGNIFIADRGNNVIRKVVVASGSIQTVAGNGSAGFSGDGGLATGAELSAPSSVAEDRFGNLFIADTGNNVIREVNASTGAITTVAGTGTAGFSGDGAAATAAELRSPARVAVDVLGNVYIADAGNNVIREVLALNGTIQTVAGNGTAGSGGDGGAATLAELNEPLGIAADSSGNLFIGDTGNQKIRKVTVAGGLISTVAGSDAGGFGGDGAAATSSVIDGSKGLALSATGDLYFADSVNGRIRKIAGVAQVPAVTISATTLTFNNQVNGTTSASQAVTISNSGAATLIVAAASTSGANASDFVATNNCTGTVAPNGSCTVTVTFTAGGNGTRTATLAIVDNAPGSPQQVSLSGTGQPPVVLTPGGLSFPIQLEGKASASQSITLTNNQSVVVNISSVAITGTNIASFAQTNSCGSNVGPNGSCTINVTFDPAVIGANAANLVITDDAVGSPQVAGLSGTGTTATADLSPGTLTFGTQVVSNASATQAVTLTNNGTDILNVTSVQVGGDDNGDFSQTNTCGTSVSVGKSCTITVTFTPIAAGTRIATIQVTDSAGNSPQTVSLTGTGLDYALAAATNSTLTATTSAGQTANFSLEVTATGGVSSTDSVTVMMACSGLPPGALCAINPTSVTATPATPGTFSVAIRTSASVPPGERRKAPPPYRMPQFYFVLAACGFWMALMARRKNSSVLVARTMSIARTAATLALLVTLGFWAAGCHANTSSASTTAGTYDITVTGTSGNATRTVTLTLTVD